jgi:hypothetical protein
MVEAKHRTTAGATGLELCYLGRLTATGGDVEFVHASASYLNFRAWPAYAQVCAKNALAVLRLRKRDPSGAMLAIFCADNWRRAHAFVALDDDLIAWEAGDEPDSVRIWKERERAPTLLTLIREASERGETVTGEAE